MGMRRDLSLAESQAVGLGRAVVTVPGRGPQFNSVFAEAQTRLLGESVCSPSPVCAVCSLAEVHAARNKKVAYRDCAFVVTKSGGTLDNGGVT